MGRLRTDHRCRRPYAGKPRRRQGQAIIKLLILLDFLMVGGTEIEPVAPAV